MCLARSRRSGSGRAPHTLQTVNEPHELFLGDVGVAQVERHGLATDYTAQHGRSYGALATQIDLSP